MNVALVIDKWKVPIFKRHLDGAKLCFNEAPGISEGIVILNVQCSDADTLKPVVMAAVRECESTRRKKHGPLHH